MKLEDEINYLLNNDYYIPVIPETTIQVANELKNITEAKRINVRNVILELVDKIDILDKKVNELDYLKAKIDYLRDIL